jgi:hypothetical protein
MSKSLKKSRAARAWKTPDPTNIEIQPLTKKKVKKCQNHALNT